MRATATLRLVPVLALAVSGCAEIARPPGGPIDRAGPVVLSMTPDSLAGGVDPATPVTIVFSEKLVHDSVRNGLIVTPYRRIDDLKWDGPILRLLPRGGWPADTTITILLGSDIQDRGLNPLGRPFQRTFATADSVAPGVLAGSIARTRAVAPPAGGAPTGGGGGAPQPPGMPPSVGSAAPRIASGPRAWIWVYRVTGDSLPDPAEANPDYRTEATPELGFRIEGVAPGDYRLFAVQDVDRRGTFSRSQDYATLHPDTLRVDPGNPVHDALRVFLINPKDPGSIAGRLSAADTASGVDTLQWGVLVSAAPAKDDTSTAWPPLRVAYTGRVESKGGFLVTGIAAGRWLIAGFADLNRDGRWAGDEPLGAPLPVEIEPTVRREVGELPRPPVPIAGAP